MKITKKRFLLIFTSLILSFSLLAGCHSADTVRNNQQNTVYSASSENENFREFTDAIFRDNVSGDILSLHTILQHPENYGITNYEKTLGRYNLDNPTDSSDISDCLTQLNSFDKNSLSKGQQITYELLKKYLETKLEYCDLFLLDTDLSTTIGIQVQLILVMSRKAQLYFLDEPIGGVDPAARDYILNTIITNYNPEASVIISTHLISDVEQILDKLAVGLRKKVGQDISHRVVDPMQQDAWHKATGTIVHPS